MKTPILSRYELTPEKEIVIDVSIETVEHLYSNFDLTAPYHIKELEQEFADYLIDCVREIHNHPFVIRISLLRMPDETRMERVRRSVKNYFRYLRELELRALKAMFKRSAILFAVGLVLLVFAIKVTSRMSHNPSVPGEVFAQGLTVAAWVSLWEAMAKLFLEWYPHKQNLSVFKRIIDAPVTFHTQGKAAE